MLMRVLAPGPAVRESLCLAPLEWKFSSPLAPQKSYPKFRNPMKSPYSGFPKYFLSKILIFGSLKHFGASATNWSERSVCASTTNLSERGPGQQNNIIEMLGAHKIPFCTHKIPFCTQKIPFCTHKIPFYTYKIPFYAHKIPIYLFPDI